MIDYLRAYDICINICTINVIGDLPPATSDSDYVEDLPSYQNSFPFSEVDSNRDDDAINFPDDTSNDSGNSFSQQNENRPGGQRPGSGGSSQRPSSGRPGNIGGQRPGSGSSGQRPNSGRPGNGQSFAQQNGNIAANRPGFGGSSGSRPGLGVSPGSRPGFGSSSSRPGFGGLSNPRPGGSSNNGQDENEIADESNNFGFSKKFGIAGVDFPIFSRENMPQTSFTCEGKENGG